MTRLALLVSVVGALLFGGVAEAANILTIDVVRQGDPNPDPLPTAANKVMDVPSLGRFWLDCMLQHDASGDVTQASVYFTNNTTTPLTISNITSQSLTAEPIVEPGECCVVIFGQAARTVDSIQNTVVSILGKPGQPSANVFLTSHVDPVKNTCRINIMAIRQ